MSELQPSGHAHGWHDHAGHKTAANLLVPGPLSDRSGQTGIASLELSCHLGVNDDTAWLLHNKILRAMAGRGSENEAPIVATVSLNEAGHPIHTRVTAGSAFSAETIADWAQRPLEPGTLVLSDGLACFRAVTTANCLHKAVVTSGKHPNDLPQFRWINTVLGNLKTSFSGTFHAFSFGKYARRYLGGTASVSTGALRWPQ